MSVKRRLLTAIVLSLSVSILTACGSVRDEKSYYNKVAYPKKITVSVFDSFAKYEGLQSGWFAKEVEDHFNMKLDLIAPNLREDGGSMIDIRAAAGNIGDLVIFSADDKNLKSLVDRGLLTDISKYLKNTKLMGKYGTAVNKLNEGLGGIYAIQGDMSTASAEESSSILEPSYCPYVRWDYYKEQGYPNVDTMEDFLPILLKMQHDHPKNEEGDKTYAFSFFPDWDGNMMVAAKQPACFYGYDELGFLLVSADGNDVQDILSKDSLYMRSLEFFNKAYRLGLVDPDSRNQTYSEVFEKYKKGQIFFSPWTFLGQSAYNTDLHMQQGEGFMPLAISDMKIYDAGCTPYGNAKKCIAVGGRAKDPERLAKFIAWLYSDDGVYCNEANADNGTAGPVGLCWKKTDEGPVFTDIGEASIIKKISLELSDKETLGTFTDGVSQLNFNAVNLKEKDDDGNPYTFILWESYAKHKQSPMLSDWQKKMQADNTMDFLKKNNMLAVARGTENPSPVQSNEIAEMRDAVRKKLVYYSWKLVFAPKKADFNETYDKMVKVCKGLGYDKVVEFDRKDAACRKGKN